MNKVEYIEYASTHKAVISELIREYHPVNRQPGRRPQDHITAPNPEAACVQVRKKIRENFEGNPVQQFEQAIVESNDNKIFKLANDTWFGIPESRSLVSRLEGFDELCALCEGSGEEE